MPAFLPYPQRTIIPFIEILMKHLTGFALAACALSLAAHAQSPAPQDPQAAVPAAPYRSAFDGYQSATEDDATPDETWRAVNRKVGEAGGHQGHMMKMEGHAVPMDKTVPVPAGHDEHQQHQGH